MRYQRGTLAEMKAADMLRDARLAAGLTQRQLAQRAGMPQSTIGRIETGAISPRVDTLERLLRAANQELRVAARPGIGIDRSQIREMLRLSPRERVELAARDAAMGLNAMTEKTVPQILLDVPITFDVGGDQQTHAPMIHATVAGTPTKLILDTGSTDHILTIELAEQVGLHAEPGEPGTDSTGALVASWMLGEVTVEIADQEFVLRDVVAITAPAPFPGFGIGGILSPQHLRPGVWAVLDLAADRFFLLDGEEADLIAWLGERTPDLQLLRLERAPGDGTILVSAAIEPFDAVVTMLDSGGKRTQFTEAAVPGASDGPQTSSGRGVGGSESFGAELEGQTLIVGEASLPLATLIVSPEMDGRGGLVGMDVLRGTVMAVSGDPHRPVIWQVAPQRK
jgi:transcriptional regulator with XRE-family HTH domain